VQALALLSTVEVSASSAVTVVADDEDGGAVCTVELSPAGPGFVTPNQAGVLTHTNHFLAEPGRSGDTMVREGPDSVLRLDHADRAMASLAADPIDEHAILGALRSHRGGPGAICCHPSESAVFGDRWQTLATVTVQPAARTMTLRRGGPCGVTADLTAIQT
jgi:isopenicillin-N N-acyltransferase-like protein